MKVQVKHSLILCLLLAALILVPKLTRSVGSPKPSQPADSRSTQTIVPPPRAGLYGRRLGLMEREGFTMVLPDINDYVDANGSWTGELPVFRIEHSGVIYDRPQDIPGISSKMVDRLNTNISHAEAVWVSKLQGLRSSQNTSSHNLK